MSPPYLHTDGEFRDPVFDTRTLISDRSLSRDYDLIGEITVADIFVKFFMLDKTQVYGVVKDKNELDEESNRIVSVVRFKKHHTIINLPSHLDEHKILQIDGVSVTREMKGLGIASYVYAMLAKLGFIIVREKNTRSLVVYMNR